MSERDDLQKKIVEFQILDTNLKMLQERAESVNQKLEDLQRTKTAIEELKNINLFEQCNFELVLNDIE